MNRRRLGRRGSRERRLVERRAVVDAAIEIMLGRARAVIDSGWLPQDLSPLGPRRHVEACRRRVADQECRGGPVDAAIVGRRFMLTVDAVCDEYFGSPKIAPAPPLPPPAANDNDEGGDEGEGGEGGAR